MNEQTIKCPHCSKDVRLDLILSDIRKLELGIGVKVLKEDDGEKEEKKS